MAWFRDPQSVVTYNKMKFIDGKFHILMEELRIKQHFSSVEHTQTNGQAEASNRVLVKGLKKRLEEDLHQVKDLHQEKIMKKKSHLVESSRIFIGVKCSTSCIYI